MNKFLDPYYVYFISDGIGNCKVGIAEYPERRRYTMQTGNANELVTKATIRCVNKYQAEAWESKIHRELKAKRVRGEWFEEKAVDEYLLNLSERAETEVTE